MVSLLRDNPLLLLFLVVAVGYPLGRLRIAGSSVGIAAVLFSGLAFGALDPDLQLPSIVYQLGLVLFVYTVGLSSGHSFLASLRRHGPRFSLLVVGMLMLAAGLIAVARLLFEIRATYAAGIFAGSLTNTPALAGVLDYVEQHAAAATIDTMLAEPVVAYSVTYPLGVVAMIVVIAVMRRRWHIDYAREAAAAHGLVTGVRQLTNRTIQVTNPAAAQRTIHDLAEQHALNVIVGRVLREGHSSLATNETRLAVDDLVSVIGMPDDVERATAALGEARTDVLDLDRSELDFRRIFVSSPQVVGRSLRELGLPRRYGALVTRVRRGDIEFVPHGHTVLEPGDRVRVVTQRNNMQAVSQFLGDSYRALSEIDVLTFSLGLALGLLVGTIPIPLPGDVTFKLGLAGGPLLVALILGVLVRTGPFVWTLPYSANLTIRQLGFILFLAGVGTRAGRAFFETVITRDGLLLCLVGAGVTTTVALLTLWIGYRLMHVPMGLLIGILAGLQTQPAVLGFGLEETDDELPNIGYAMAFPVATIAKIIIAQLLIVWWW